ncbi:MAG TPA: hypothetical protein VFK06_17890 [Candidatus Angelobacter sp.]|nr:hypothetical protein [Candidatus Angelobacter sp.]
MKQKRKGKAKGKAKAGELARLKARRLGEKTQAKAFTLPKPVLEEIRKAAAIYGSQGRALQVGSELLVRMRKHLRLSALKAPMVRMTYRLAPRTIEVIGKLSGTMYEDEPHVLAACVEALKIKKL